MALRTVLSLTFLWFGTFLLNFPTRNPYCRARMTTITADTTYRTLAHVPSAALNSAIVGYLSGSGQSDSGSGGGDALEVAFPTIVVTLEPPSSDMRVNSTSSSPIFPDKARLSHCEAVLGRIFHLLHTFRGHLCSAICPCPCGSLPPLPTAIPSSTRTRRIISLETFSCRRSTITDLRTT